MHLHNNIFSTFMYNLSLKLTFQHKQYQLDIKINNCTRAHALQSVIIMQWALIIAFSDLSYGFAIQ